MIFNAKRPKQEGEQSRALFLQRAERICFGLLKAIAFVGGAGMFLLGVSLIAARADIWLGWFLTLVPFIVWKFFWIYGVISWLSKKIWTLCETIFHYIQHRIWLSIAFWSVVIWQGKPWGSLVFAIVNFVIGSPLSEWIGRTLAKFGIRIVPCACCCHRCRH